MVGEEESGETDPGDEGRENWKMGEDEREDEVELGAEGGGTREPLMVSRIREAEGDSLVSSVEIKTNMSQRNRASRISRSNSATPNAAVLEDPTEPGSDVSEAPRY